VGSDSVASTAGAGGSPAELFRPPGEAAAERAVARLAAAPRLATDPPMRRRRVVLDSELSMERPSGRGMTARILLPRAIGRLCFG
jgi:hypothetical protein